jgi:16S rRNA (guanine(966)-N(2))-methyltransferase RsmD
MSGLRVVGGSARGRRLKLVPGEGTRPIGDRVKESLFNIIGADVEGSAWLDVFAGTGSVGIEALSRGARTAVFVDSARTAVETVRENLVTTRLDSLAVVRQADAFDFLAGHAGSGFDYVYLAPPQYRRLWIESLAAVDRKPALMDPDGWVIVQIDPREDESLELERLVRFDERVYGQTKLLFFRAE